jgi:transposase
MLADRLDYVVGVDTHRDQHVLAIIVAATGALVAQRSVPTNTRGYADAVRFADDYAPGPRLWAVEGAGHYGAGLTRYLDSHAETVHEVSRSSCAARHAQHGRLSRVKRTHSRAQDSIKRLCAYCCSPAAAPLPQSQEGRPTN